MEHKISKTQIKNISRQLTLAVPFIETVIIQSFGFCTFWRKACRHDVAHNQIIFDDVSGLVGITTSLGHYLLDLCSI